MPLPEPRTPHPAPLFQTVIGLEVHVQLLTETKLFCRCSARFGGEPNTQTCPVCIGMPGALPVMNRRAYELALKTAVALDCEIPPFTKWDRKQYYYPDLPKGYQISQYDLPMSQRGWLEISDAKGGFEPKRIGITRAHLEEDAGKSMHDERAGVADSRIDLNRAGTPLLEIVSEPDMRSPAEARAYLDELKLLLTYLGVSDCNMQEGSLRVDANVNLHVETPDGTVATPIVEIKNMNSFRAVERALAYEAQRQFDVWQQTGQKKGDVPKQTRGWDDAAEVTRGQRHKEESSDYRYFPDPDLAPVTTTPERVTAVRASLGELPAALRSRLERDYGLKPYDAGVLVNQGRAAATYYLTLADALGDPKLASNWMQQDVSRWLNDHQTTIDAFPIEARRLAALLAKVKRGELETTRARDVFAAMLDSPKPVDEVMSDLGIVAVDESATVELCRELLAANPKIVADVKNGNEKALGSLVGQAKKRNPNVHPGQVREIAIKLIQEMP
ncbi:MAG: Asp-tRNA(Asn)/Glu-tRNA(Gln) amidotransferase GatCAB subunit B [Planctomycetota bacterium]|nr:MAG: Asp-tRNA(Asn)/Glu-tRNA(Gln) amidotransferase GatCAB subunit B [Planctomycetota bacterium]